MSPRSIGALNNTTLEKIKLYLAGDTSINIPPKVWEAYNKHYVKPSIDPQELQDAVEMTFTPEQSQPSGNAQVANPFDDVILDEGDNTPPWEEDNKPKEFIKDPTLGVSEDFGEQIDENHEDVFLNALNEQISAGATPPTTNSTPSQAKRTTPVPPIKTRSIKVADAIKVEEGQVVTATQESPAYDPGVVYYGQPGWTNYILNCLSPESEKIIDKKGLPRPKCMGLRRMVEQHIGPILQTKMKIVATPTRENCGAWAIQAKVTIKVTNKCHPANGSLVEWTDIANSFASMDGQSDIVTLNPVASAYTAALSRCFRSLLGLSGVYSSEEMEEKGKPQKSHAPDNQVAMQKKTGPMGFIKDS